MTWWAWMLVLALPVGYLRLVAHELSHAVTIIVLGGKVYWRRFRPWPHRDDGRWRWGRMYREDLPGDLDDMLVSLAPLARATVGMLAWAPFAMFWTPLWVCVLWELTDIIHWWVGWARSETSDGGKVRALLRAKRTAREQLRGWRYKEDIRSMNRALAEGLSDEDVTEELVPQSNEMLAILREASTYDAEKLEACRRLWNNLPGVKVEDEE